MSVISTNEKKTRTSIRKEKIIRTVKKGLLYTGIAIGGVVLLVALYQILQVLFVGAILLAAYLAPRRWHW